MAKSRWMVNVLGKAGAASFEISVVREDNEAGRLYFTGFGKDKVLISHSNGISGQYPLLKTVWNLLLELAQTVADDLNFQDHLVLGRLRDIVIEHSKTGNVLVAVPKETGCEELYNQILGKVSSTTVYASVNDYRKFLVLEEEVFGHVAIVKVNLIRAGVQIKNYRTVCVSICGKAERDAQALWRARRMFGPENTLEQELVTEYGPMIIQTKKGL